LNTSSGKFSIQVQIVSNLNQDTDMLDVWAAPFVTTVRVSDV